MGRHPPLLTIVGLAAVFAAVPSRSAARGHDDPAKLRDQIEHQTNPVKKAKLEIRLARVELRQVVDAYSHNQSMQGQRLLAAYLQDMNDSWNVLRKSGRNAASNPSGFMQLEIALRENARVLRDLHDRVAYFDQAPIAKTLGVLNLLHSRVLLALFPGAAPPGTITPRTDADSWVGQRSHP